MCFSFLLRFSEFIQQTGASQTVLLAIVYISTKLGTLNRPLVQDEFIILVIELLLLCTNV